MTEAVRLEPHCRKKKMLHTLINKLFGQRDAGQGPQNIQPATSANKGTEAAPFHDTAHNDDPEIQIVAGRFGELHEGKVIETTLTELQEILPRPRRRADAYATVSKRLAAMGVQLVIKREVRHDK